MPRSMRDRRRSRMDRRSSRRGRDYNYGIGMDYREHSSKYGDMPDARYDYTSSRRNSQYGREYDMGYGYHYPYMSRDRRYDYGEPEEGLSREELMDWQKDLEHEIDPQYRANFEKSRVIQRAKEMGVDFKDFDEEEYVTTVMMIASDFGRTVGMNDTDKMYRMAYDWLNDPDAGIRGSEKLAVYYDEIVCAE